MPVSPTSDPKLKSLFTRVEDDLAHLRSDLGSLISHTGRHTIADNARELSSAAREKISAGSDYATEYIRENPTRSYLTLTGGLLLLGAVGTGIYFLCKNCAEKKAAESDLVDSTLDEPNQI